DGSFSYDPDSGFAGSDSFTYVANDGQADSNVATVSLTVNAVNDAPVAADDAYSTDEDTPLSVAGPGVLTNDSDVDGDALTAILVDDVSNGSLTLNANGSFSYTPDGGFSGSDSFTYTANDGQADSNVATVSLTVTAGTATLRLAPSDDAMVTSKRPADNYGAETSLEIRSQNQETIHSYLKFDVTGVSGTITSARIRVYADKATDDGGAIYLVSNDYQAPVTGPWIEEGLTWENAPTLDGAALSTVGAVSSGTWVEFDVTAAILGEGVYSFGLGTDSSNRAAYRSKEAAEFQPVLIIEIE
ncbi:MAG: tandem-95 repeat protein, partial [Anaerolineae bacterium]